MSGRTLTRNEHDAMPMLAAIDEPPETDIWDVATPSVRIGGWVLSTRGRTCRVVVSIGAVDRVEIEPSIPRPDVFELHAQLRGQADERCGFSLDVPFSEDDELVVSVACTDGEFVVMSDEYRYHRAPRPTVPEFSLPSTVDAPSRSRVERRPRARYQQVWDGVAGDIDTAKVAVAGYTDEGQFERVAEETVRSLEVSVGIQPDDVVLEIGAGVGRVGAALAPRCSRWIGTDVSEKMLAHAAERLSAFDNVDTIVTNGWDLAPIPSSSVDLVYSTVVFMHLDEWERFAYVCEAMRVLRPGGRVYVDNFNLLGDEGWAFFVHHVQDYHPLARPANISKASTPQELKAYLDRAGFADVRVRGTESFAWAVGRKPSTP